MSSSNPAPGTVHPDGPPPLRVAAFRNIWAASLLSNFGQLILGVGAAWEMTRLTDSPEMVALAHAVATV